MRLSPEFFKNGLPTGSRLAGAGRIVRAQSGPRSRRDAQRLAAQLATLCQTISSFAAEMWKGISMDASQIDGRQNELVQHTVAACQNAISCALENPAHAIGLARGLGAALSTLQLVGQEVERGEAGIAAVTSNAEALTRSALSDVLKLASVPEEALAALAAVEQAAPSFGPMPAPPPPAAAPTANPGLPLFSATSQSYIDMRIARDGQDHEEIPRLTLRRQVFLDLVGDRTPDKYFPSDLQAFVNKMQHFPSNVTKRADFAGKSTAEILEANKDFAIAPPMAKKTMADGYVANVKTMMRHGMSDHRYHDPFAGAKLSYPKAYLASKPREGVSVEVTNRVFASGVESNLLVDGMFPLLAKRTSRRLGLLTYLQGADIRKKDGVWIAQTNGIVEVVDENTGQKTWKRVPIKTEESMTFYVLHNFLDKIGFVAWMRQQNGFVFKEAHKHPNPSKYMSKTMQNLLKRCGARGGEVFHSLRGDAIDGMRRQPVDNRARRLQAGHELGDEHDKYGFRALSAEECQRLANLPLEDGIDWSVFEGRDFDAMAAQERKRGRRPKLKEG